MSSIWLRTWVSIPLKNTLNNSLFLVETNAELREGESQVLKGLIAFVLAICVQHYDKSEEK